MRFLCHNYGRIAAIAAYCLLLDAGNSSRAQDGPSVVVQPAESPELVPAVPMPPTTIEPAPVYEEMVLPTATEVKAIPVASIDYDVTHRARKRFGSSPTVEIMMITQNPADGCFYEIPLCLPVCCTGEPKVESRCGLLGRGVVEYCYECGLEVEVKFRHRGDVEVEYGT